MNTAQELISTLDDLETVGPVRVSKLREYKGDQMPPGAGYKFLIVNEEIMGLSPGYYIETNLPPEVLYDYALEQFAVAVTYELKIGHGKGIVLSTADLINTETDGTIFRIEE